MIGDFLDLVDSSLLLRSGRVFYSGRAAFAAPSRLYVLGLNPGGDPVAHGAETLAGDIDRLHHDLPDVWSAYRDESWEGGPPGAWGMQPRLLHFFDRLGLDPAMVPCGNVVFVRTVRERDLRAERDALLAACWPMHRAVIARLGVRVVVCLGGTAGAWVRDMTGAHTPIDAFVENNRRRWSSRTHRNDAGVQVVTLTHPSRVDWRNPATDPTGLVISALSGAGEAAR